MPTVTISGTTDIEDNFIWEAASVGNGNEGGRIQVFSNAAVGNRSWVIFRVRTAAIPSGIITGFRLLFGPTNSGRLYNAYRFTDANTWVEGTGVGGTGPEIGASCWNFAKYNTQAWAGSAGAMTSGVDYTADASPPNVTTTTSRMTLVLPPAWASEWKSGSRVNNGFVLQTTGSGFHAFSATEDSSNQPTFEIDYTVPPPVLFWKII